MSDRIYNALPRLKLLLKAKSTQRRNIVHTAPDELIQALCEIALNVLRGNIPLTGKQITKLKKQKTLIKLLARKSVSIPKKRRAINQRGGAFLLPLLSAALPLITSLFTSRPN